MAYDFYVIEGKKLIDYKPKSNHYETRMAIKRYLMSNGDVRLSEHFMLHEFQSKNGCNEIFVDEELIKMLERIYKHFNCSRATDFELYIHKFLPPFKEDYITERK